MEIIFCKYLNSIAKQVVLLKSLNLEFCKRNNAKALPGDLCDKYKGCIKYEMLSKVLVWLLKDRGWRR